MRSKTPQICIIDEKTKKKNSFARSARAIVIFDAFLCRHHQETRHEIIKF